MSDSTLRSLLSRRSVLFGLAAAPLAVVAACSGDKPEPAGSTTTTTPSTTTTTPAAPKVTGAGLPADLLTALTALYVGGKVSAVGTVAPALAKRKPLGKAVKVTGTTGTWKGAPIATVVQGKDLTMLVKDGKTWKVVGGWWPSMATYRPAFPTMRVLAIGSDARNPQPVTKCRADALHIIGVDAKKGVGGIVGIPRDSWVSLSSGGNSKINAALVFGGVAGQVKTIERASGVQIDGYVITGFKGFRAMVKALGGIVLVAQKSLQSVDGFRIVKPGSNKLDAKHALAFARERKHLPNGDFGRSANQGALIKAGITMARKAGPGALAGMLSKMSPHLSTDLSVTEVLNLSASLYVNASAGVPNKVVPGSIGTREGQSVVLLGSGARSIFSDMKNGLLRA
ncbi:LCP family protein [Pedococcus dokdonensis]|uniref:LCP family protein n=1 Tax=Pedococcus dokdonensis TaxID=443156 RepID=UPI0012FDFA81|nr:LCP family protein [Pedococcus dokdonensis]